MRLKNSKKEIVVDKKHALVFYNYSESSDFILSYSEVIDIIKKKFGIILEYEPSIIS